MRGLASRQAKYIQSENECKILNAASLICAVLNDVNDYDYTPLSCQTDSKSVIVYRQGDAE